MGTLQVIGGRERDLGGFSVRRVLPAEGRQMIGPFIFSITYSLGNLREIRPGDVNWMTAGRGIAHSERTPQSARTAGEKIHGLQSWVALPDGQEDIEPNFTHYPESVLPRRSIGGVELSVVAADAYGLHSPVVTLWPTLYVHVQLTQGSSLEVPADHDERAVYVVQGEIMIGETKILAGQLAVLEASATVTPRAYTQARAMLLGGKRFPTPRYIW